MKRTLVTLAGIATLGAGGVSITDAQINPYQDVQVMDAGIPVQALQIEKDSSLPEGGKTKTIVNIDKPRIELQRWNGEVALGVTYTGLPANTTGSRPLLSKNVEWGTVNPVVGLLGGVPAQTMEAVPIDATTTMEDGGMEINTILNSAPASNIFTFKLDNWQNLDFFYQAPLWQEAGLKAPTADCTDTDCTTSEGTLHRPVTVVGSYAVYYKDHANHLVGSTNYATGKAYHIFRPLVTDNSGNTTWADLSYSNGVLSVIVPQSFLDNASYPVKVDPTFGYTSIGGTGSNSNLSIALIGNQLYTASTGDTITSYSIYNGSASSISYNLSVYDVSGGLPSTRQFSATAVTGSGIGWLTTTAVSQSLTASTQYSVASDVSGATTSNERKFDTGTGSQRSADTNTSLPATWTNAATSAAKYSFYATYTASGGSTPDSSYSYSNWW